MGELKLIGTTQSFPCARIQWALKLKGVEYDFIEEDLLNKSALLHKYNPVHKKVPALVHGDKPVAESLVILEYIGETWKENPLLSQDPFEKSAARFWANFADQKVLMAVWGAFTAEGEQKEKAIESALEQLAYIEQQIEGKKFFGGDKIGYLDIVVGWMSQWLNAMEEVGDMKLLEAERFPFLHEWSQNFIQAPAISECIPPREKLVEYFQFSLSYARTLAANKP